MSFDKQKQVDFSTPKNAELQAISLYGAQVRQANRDRAFDAMLKTLKQVDEWHTKLGLVITITPSVKEAITVAEIAKQS